MDLEYWEQQLSSLKEETQNTLILDVEDAEVALAKIVGRYQALVESIIKEVKDGPQ